MNVLSRYCVNTMLVAALFLAGCGSNGPKTVPVYGKVSFVGRDAPNICRVYFHPVETDGGVSRPAAATADASGSYEARAFRDSKGLVPGTYEVRVSYFDLKPGANPESENGYIESGYDAGELVVESGSRGVKHDIEVPAKSG